jgi:hypothetical protein
VPSEGRRGNENNFGGIFLCIYTTTCDPVPAHLTGLLHPHTSDMHGTCNNLLEKFPFPVPVTIAAVVIAVFKRARWVENNTGVHVVAK